MHNFCVIHQVVPLYPIHNQDIIQPHIPKSVRIFKQSTAKPKIFNPQDQIRQGFSKASQLDIQRTGYSSQA